MGGIAIILAILAVALLAAIVVFAVTGGGILSRLRTKGELPQQQGSERPEHVAVGSPEQQDEMAAASRDARS